MSSTSNHEIGDNFLIPNAIIDDFNESMKIIILRQWQSTQIEELELQQRNIFVSRHPWEDNELLLSHFKYLNKFYETALIALSQKLNAIHKKKHGIKFWRILIGPWLYNYLSVIFERWINIEESLKSCKIDGLLISQNSSQSPPPFDYNSFSLLLHNPEWNEILYEKIFKRLSNKKIIRNSNLKYSESKLSISRTQSQNIVINKLKYFYHLFGMHILHNKGVVFFNPYLTNGQIFKFAKKLLVFPILPDIATLNIKKSNINYDLRANEINIPTNSDFESFFAEEVLNNIPSLFLEDFDLAIKEVSEKIGTAKFPKAIVTGTGFYHPVFSFYMAQCSENGVPIYGIQHGGAYGTVLDTFNERHEIEISDKYLTWGWTSNNLNVVDFYKVRKNIPKIQNNFPDLYLVIFLNANENYLMRLGTESYIHDINPLLEFEAISMFLSTILPVVEDKILFREYPLDFGWNDKHYFSKRFPMARWDKNSSVEQIFNLSKVALFTTASTGYLETLASNFCTIIILTKERQVREDARLYFDALEEAGILHKDFSSAAIHINRYWHEINVWWENDKVQLAIRSFVNRFARDSDNLPEELFRVFQK